MYRLEYLKKDFFWLSGAGLAGAVLMMIVFQLAGEISLPGELREKPGEIALGFALVTVMIAFIAGAFRSVAFVAGRWSRRWLIALGVAGFALPMIDIGDEGGFTLVDIYECILPGFLLAALLMAIPQLIYAGIRRLRLTLAS